MIHMNCRWLLYNVCKRCYTTVTRQKLVLGCGSNVVDQFFMVPAVPKVGEKGYFSNPNKILEQSLVGGVTLNHLSWASLLGVPTGLLALQGDDPSGKMIRQTMSKLGVSSQFVQVNPKYTTGESYVFVQEDGERSIVMARGATSLIDNEVVKNNFEAAITNNCQILTTEISQVPLSGVLAVLRAAKAAGVTTVLDLDVAPSVAMNEAGLGNLEELIECVQLADVLKPAKHAAQELLPYLASSAKVGNMMDLTRIMRDVCGSKLLAVTCGEEPSILATEQHLVQVPTTPVKKLVDATGAGDAFLGGLVSGIYYNGLPNDEDSLRKLGKLGNIVASNCCEVLGALPNTKARNKLQKDLGGIFPSISLSNVEEDEQQGTGLKAFKESLTLDVECAKDVWESLKTTQVKQFIDILESCPGRVLVSGVGKSAIVARRMSASLASTGTPSHFVHATEWVHGDLGNAKAGDLVILFSHGGNTQECVHVARLLQKCSDVRVLAIVGKNDCALKEYCDAMLCYEQGGDIKETLTIVPSRSILIQEMLINGLVSELISRRRYTLQDFFRTHPGGNIGDKRRTLE